MTGNGFTRTQRAMLDVLSDGMAHTREELHACCGPSSIGNVSVHVSLLRKKLPKGETIICEFANRKICYRRVRLLASANDGRY